MGSTIGDGMHLTNILFVTAKLHNVVKCVGSHTSFSDASDGKSSKNIPLAY